MLKGYIFGFLYILLVSASTIWLNNLGKNIPIPVLLLYTSLTSIVIFNLINIQRLKNNYNLIFKSKKNWIYMSVSLVLIWYFTYYGTIYSSADFFIATAFLTTAFITSLIARNKIKMIACIVSIGLIYFYSKDSAPLPLLASVIAGIAGYAYYHSSYQFSKETNISAVSLLSIRFYFVLVFAIIYTIGSGQIEHLKISTTEIFVLILFSLINMVTPAILSQTCLHSIGVSKFTFLNTLIPALTFLLEAVIKDMWQLGMLLACMCATITLNIDNLQKLFKFASTTVRQRHL